MEDLEGLGRGVVRGKDMEHVAVEPE
jgi:hypothetical protein